MNLPTQFIPGLKILALLDEKVFQEFSSGLGQIPPKMYRKDVSSKLKGLVESIPEQDFKELTYAVFGLHIGLATGGETFDDFVSEILEDCADSQLSLTEEQFQTVRGRILLLLKLEALRVGAKAQTVFFENERNLADARVITDLRPVFIDKPTEVPAAAVAIHNLKLSYLERGEIRDFYVAMDSKDLQKVIDAMERAKEKQKSLIKGMGASPPMSIIEPD